VACSFKTTALPTPGAAGSTVTGLGPTRPADHISRSAAWLYAENRVERQFSHRCWARRQFSQVNSDNAANSRHRVATKVSPKLNLCVRPSNRVLHQRRLRFHSNDARGHHLMVEPKPAFARREGAAAGAPSGVEIACVPKPPPDCALSVYRLDFDSELTFAGATGTTQWRPAAAPGWSFQTTTSPTAG
jgi:hypothetical protein